MHARAPACVCVFREHNFSDIHDIAIYVSIKIIDVFAQRTQNTFPTVRCGAQRSFRSVHILWHDGSAACDDSSSPHVCPEFALRARARIRTATARTTSTTMNVYVYRRMCRCAVALCSPSHSIHHPAERQTAFDRFAHLATGSRARARVC